MRVYYDGAIYTLQPRGGINRYFKNLIEELGDRISPLVSLTKPINESAPHAPTVKRISHRRFAFRPGRLSYYLEGRYFQLLSKVFRPEIIHPTYYEFLTQKLPPRGSTPVVATIFDLLHERYPTLTDPLGVHRKNKSQLVRRADMVITLSENARQNVIEYFGISPDRIRCIYPGCNFPIVRDVPKPEVISPPYIVFVGNRWSYKNFPLFLRLVQSFKDVLDGPLGLVVGPELSSEEQQLIQEMGIKERISSLGYLEDSALAVTLQNAVALIYPSAYEGFGFPIIEAQANRCPVIAPPVSSIPEVGGAGVRYVMPSDFDQLRNNVQILLYDSEKRLQLIEQASQNCARFSWAAAADATLALYKEVLT